ncbi:MAG: large subunit ribosomal protein L13 [Myxococcota bacterium]|jgi:large subunit ribosomal protein L13
MSTVSFNSSMVDRNWHIVDLEGKTLGRVASQIASILRGKHKPQFTPNADVGDFVVVINSDKFVLTGNKMAQKIYYRHSGWMGGLKEITAEKQMEKDSRYMVEKAVKGMLPRGPLGRAQLKKLKIYATADHPHAAQQPQPLAL